MSLYAPTLPRGEAGPRKAPPAALFPGLLDRPVLPPGYRYLLMFRRDTHGRRLKPLAFAGLDGLARHIHRQRAGAGLQLSDDRVLFLQEDEPRDGVGVFVLDPSTADLRRYLGWAWVNGAGRITLEAALQQAEPGPSN